MIAVGLGAIHGEKTGRPCKLGTPIFGHPDLS
jgi:hypothetical protein